MKKTKNIKRIGKYWIDRSLIDEGYDPNDIFGNERLELPELMDSRRRRHVSWLVCPTCGERSQVDPNDPCCSYCGWGEDHFTRIDDPENSAA